MTRHVEPSAADLKATGKTFIFHMGSSKPARVLSVTCPSSQSKQVMQRPDS